MDMVCGERTVCEVGGWSLSSTASILPRSTSRGSRSRRRRDPQQLFYTFSLSAIILLILILSPSAYANRCTPTFTLLQNGDLDRVSREELNRTKVWVREGASYKLNCSLSKYHSIKWTINGRELTPQLRDEWDVEIEGVEEMDNSLFSELRVNNATPKRHSGEYRCTPQCMSSEPGANSGVIVVINIAISVTIADSKGADPQNVRKYVGREKSVELTCTTPVPHAQMTWYRIKDDRVTEENMAEVCVGSDKTLQERMKHPPKHCTVTPHGGSESTSLTLKINRARKEGNETLQTIADFRKYKCRATKEGNQDGEASVELLETVSVDRKFEKGERSFQVVEGNELKIYCEVHGIDRKEIDSGSTTVVWTKDGQDLPIDDQKMKKIAEYGEANRGKPYRVGFLYGMAEPEHRGQYTCVVNRPFIDDGSNSTKVHFSYYVRVKDKLGPLWPFLGICGEVVILFTIILIYEKRRNKTELDESDTDGSPDQ